MIIIPAKAGRRLHFSLEKERYVPCSVCHRELKVFSGTDSSAKQATAQHFRSKQEEATKAALVLSNASQGHTCAYIDI